MSDALHPTPYTHHTTLYDARCKMQEARAYLDPGKSGPLGPCAPVPRSWRPGLEHIYTKFYCAVPRASSTRSRSSVLRLAPRGPGVAACGCGVAVAVAVALLRCCGSGCGRRVDALRAARVCSQHRICTAEQCRFCRAMGYGAEPAP